VYGILNHYTYTNGVKILFGMELAPQQLPWRCSSRYSTADPIATHGAAVVGLGRCRLRATIRCKLWAPQQRTIMEPTAQARRGRAGTVAAESSRRPLRTGGAEHMVMGPLD